MSNDVIPGVALLRDYIDRHGLTCAEFARRTLGGTTKVDRVTMSNIVNGHAKRVSLGVALAISRATDGEIPVDAFESVPAKRSRARKAAA